MERIMPDDIERLEEAMVEARKEVKRTGCGSGVIKIPGGLLIPRPQISSVIGGKEVIINVSPMEIIGYSPDSVLAKVIRFEMLSTGRDMQMRIAVFERPAIVNGNGVFMKVHGGKRFQVDTLVPFDPRKVFSGSQKDQKVLKSSGISFR